MTKEAFAAMIDGREYPFELTKAEAEQAKKKAAIEKPAATAPADHWKLNP